MFFYSKKILVSCNNCVSFCFQIADLVSWCDNHSLQLNVYQTKHIFVPFRKDNCTHNKIFIIDQEVETVGNYNYLGININYLDLHTQSFIELIK